MTSRPPLLRRGGRLAFTLLELSVVVMIMALLAGAALRYASSLTNTNNVTATNTNLDAIEAALMNFRIANNRLPCPASLTQYENAANFGTETSSVQSNGVNAPLADGICGYTTNNIFTTYGIYNNAFNTEYGGAGTYVAPGATNNTSIDPLAASNNYYDPVSYGNIVGGAVPTKALGLPDSYAYDAWGRKIFYAVDRRFTITNAFSVYQLTNVFNTYTVTFGANIGATAVASAVENMPTAGTAPVTSCPAPVGSTPDTCTAGAIVVMNNWSANSSAINNAITTSAAYVLVSYGKDGAGGYMRNLSSTPILYSNYTSNTNEWKNGHYVYFYSACLATVFDRYFVQMPPSNAAGSRSSFNNIVRFKTRTNLATSQELQ